MDSNFWSGIIGALVGSIAGGAITYFIQLSSFRESRGIRSTDDLRDKKMLAASLLFKAVRIHGNFAAINSHMKECSARLQNPKDQPWQTFQPFANFPAAVHFTAEEQSMLFGLKNNDIFRITIDLDVAHNALIDATRFLSNERRQLAEQIVPESFEGIVGSGTIDKQT